MNMAFQNFVRKTRLAQSIVNYCVIVYMDDILVYSSSYEGHVQHIEWALHALRDAGFKVALEKCQFFLTTISFLGHVVTDKGLQPEPQKVAAVRDAPVPTTITQVRTFLGLASYYRRFTKGFAAIAGPLTNLLCKDQPLIWTPRCDQAFSKLKAALISTPVLIRPDPEKPFVLITDWQPEAISAILAQVGPSALEGVVEYASKSVPACKCNYAAPTGECYAALWGINHFRAYLYGRKFTLSMDFDIRHRKHKRHGNADGLTRLHRPEKVPKSEEPRGHISKIRQVCHPRLNADLRRLMRFSCDEGICAAAAFRIEGSPHAVVFAEVTAIHRRAGPRTSHVTTVAAFSGDISSVNPQWHTAILTSLREWTEQVSNVWQHVLARQGYNLIPIFASDFGNIRRSPPKVPGCRQLIAQELIAPIVQLADDLSPDIYLQSDDNPAPYIFERSLNPYLQWTACLEEPRDEDTLPSRQEYLKPYDIIPHAFYPKAEKVVIDDDDEDDENEETSEEGSYSEHSEGELSEGEEEEEETGSEWEALSEEATRTGTEAEDSKAARKRHREAPARVRLRS
ncbi:hypothetical protein CBR_g23350 [Chara braunii]|uniref:Reverse transcriptase domain-containing protein n=1 Tax=Chara braunii TaxID=69332 RepID=A0A388L3Y7_CHABU|nr:hypothetical protein CBR_g23350 [Chara braunii]|eukprot:GBG77024.1 hypothetical protein CBR_g23350 [Chara braunii]